MTLATGIELNMDLRRLRYFVAVAKMRSFTEAARTLNMAQPPLSQRIREIEIEVGAPLFDRHVRPLALTAAGRLFYEQAINVLRASDLMDTAVKKFIAAERSRFVFGLVPAAYHAHIPDVVRAYCKRLPDVDFSLVELTSIEQVAALKEGRIDAGLCGLVPPDSEISMTELKREQIVVAIPPNHHLGSSKRSIDLIELAEQNIILYPSEPRPSFADHVLSACRTHGVEFGQVTEVREFYTALVLVAAGRGVCLMPESAMGLAYPGVQFRRIAQSIASSMMLCHRGEDESVELRTMLLVLDEIFGTKLAHPA